MFTTAFYIWFEARWWYVKYHISYWCNYYYRRCVSTVYLFAFCIYCLTSNNHSFIPYLSLTLSLSIYLPIYLTYLYIIYMSTITALLICPVLSCPSILQSIHRSLWVCSAAFFSSSSHHSTISYMSILSYGMTSLLPSFLPSFLPNAFYHHTTG